MECQSFVEIIAVNNYFRQLSLYFWQQKNIDSQVLANHHG